MMSVITNTTATQQHNHATGFRSEKREDKPEMRHKF